MFKEYIGYKFNSGVKATIKNITYHPFHVHDDTLELICVLDGELDISNSAADYHLSHGDVYIFNANEFHKISSNTDNIVLTVQLHKNNYIPQSSLGYDLYFVCDSFRLKNKNTADLYYLRFLLAKIYFEYTKDDASDIALESLARRLMEHLTDNFKMYYYTFHESGKYEIALPPKYKSKNTELYNKIYRIEYEHIHVNYAEKLQLKEIAAKEYMSVPYLSACIKDVFGISFSDLLSLVRCEKSEILLSTTEKTLDEISVAVGFSNRKHYIANFKKWYQKTPGEFRKAIHKDERATEIISTTFDYNFALLLLNSYLDQY